MQENPGYLVLNDAVHAVHKMWNGDLIYRVPNVRQLMLVSLSSV
jgi:hypothetical protein